ASARICSSSSTVKGLTSGSSGISSTAGASTSGSGSASGSSSRGTWWPSRSKLGRSQRLKASTRSARIRSLSFLSLIPRCIPCRPCPRSRCLWKHPRERRRRPRPEARASQRLRRPRVSYHFLGTLATENDFAGIGHAPGNGENFLLRRLHLADADRPLGLQIVLQQLGGTLGHVAEDLVLDLVVSPLERHDQHLAGDFTQQQLDAPVVHVGKIIKHEHQILDLVRQILVHFAD